MTKKQWETVGTTSAAPGRCAKPAPVAAAGWALSGFSFTPRAISRWPGLAVVQPPGLKRHSKTRNMLATMRGKFLDVVWYCFCFC